jgi:hypothetical protein
MPIRDDSEITRIITDCIIRVRYKDFDALRELAKSNMVRLKWTVAKSAGVPLFHGSIDEWNPLQVMLVYWLTYYSNIESAYERPPSRVVDNNAMLDKWVVAKSKEAENEYENNWSKSSAGVAKSAMDHDEVYQFTDD